LLIAIVKETIEHVQVALDFVFTHDLCRARKQHVSKMWKTMRRRFLYEWCIVERDADDNGADSFGSSSPHEQCESVSKDNFFSTLKTKQRKIKLS